MDLAAKIFGDPMIDYVEKSPIFAGFGERD